MYRAWLLCRCWGKYRRDFSEEPIFVQSDSSDEDDIDDRESERLSKTIPKRDFVDQAIGDGIPPSATLSTEANTGLIQGFYGRQEFASVPVVSPGPLRPVTDALAPQDVTLQSYGLREKKLLNEESTSLNAEHWQRTPRKSVMPKVDSAVGTFSDSILAGVKTNQDSKGGSNSYPSDATPYQCRVATTMSGYASSSTKATAAKAVLNHMALAASKQASKSIADTSVQLGLRVGSQSLAWNRCSVCFIAGLIAACVTAASLAAGFLTQASTLSVEGVSVTPSISPSPFADPARTCLQPNEEESVVSIRAVNLKRLLTYDEQLIVGKAFINVYNNISLRCNDVYKRLLIDASLWNQSLELNTDGSPFLANNWLGIVLCDQCPPESPLFDAENWRAMKPDGIYYSVFITRMLVELDKLVTAVSISSPASENDIPSPVSSSGQLSLSTISPSFTPSRVPNLVETPNPSAMSLWRTSMSLTPSVQSKFTPLEATTNNPLLQPNGDNPASGTPFASLSSNQTIVPTSHSFVGLSSKAPTSAAPNGSNLPSNLPSLTLPLPLPHLDFHAMISGIPSVEPLWNSSIPPLRESAAPSSAHLRPHLENPHSPSSIRPIAESWKPFSLQDIPKGPSSGRFPSISHATKDIANLSRLPVSAMLPNDAPVESPNRTPTKEAPSGNQSRTKLPSIGNKSSYAPRPNPTSTSKPPSSTARLTISPSEYTLQPTGPTPLTILIDRGKGPRDVAVPDVSSASQTPGTLVSSPSLAHRPIERPSFTRPDVTIILSLAPTVTVILTSPSGIPSTSTEIQRPHQINIAPTTLPRSTDKPYGSSHSVATHSVNKSYSPSRVQDATTSDEFPSLRPNPEPFHSSPASETSDGVQPFNSNRFPESLSLSSGAPVTVGITDSLDSSRKSPMPALTTREGLSSSPDSPSRSPMPLLQSSGGPTQFVATSVPISFISSAVTPSSTPSAVATQSLSIDFLIDGRTSPPSNLSEKRETLYPDSYVPTFARVTNFPSDLDVSLEPPIRTSSWTSSHAPTKTRSPISATLVPFVPTHPAFTVDRSNNGASYAPTPSSGSKDDTPLPTGSRRVTSFPIATSDASFEPATVALTVGTTKKMSLDPNSLASSNPAGSPASTTSKSSEVPVASGIPIMIQVTQRPFDVSAAAITTGPINLNDHPESPPTGSPVSDATDDTRAPASLHPTLSSAPIEVSATIPSEVSDRPMDISDSPIPTVATKTTATPPVDLINKPNSLPISDSMVIPESNVTESTRSPAGLNPIPVSVPLEASVLIQPEVFDSPIDISISDVPTASTTTTVTTPPPADFGSSARATQTPVNLSDGPDSLPASSSIDSMKSDVAARTRSPVSLGSTPVSDPVLSVVPDPSEVSNRPIISNSDAPADVSMTIASRIPPVNFSISAIPTTSPINDFFGLDPLPPSSAIGGAVADVRESTQSRASLNPTPASPASVPIDVAIPSEASDRPIEIRNSHRPTAAAIKSPTTSVDMIDEPNSVPTSTSMATPVSDLTESTRSPAKLNPIQFAAPLEASVPIPSKLFEHSIDFSQSDAPTPSITTTATTIQPVNFSSFTKPATTPVNFSDNPVSVKPGENDDGKNFVDCNNGSISGTVKDDRANVLSGVKIELRNVGTGAITTTVTDTNGYYLFADIEPGVYDVKEMNPVGYPLDVSDLDSTGDSETVVDSHISVTLTPGENDDNNDFVDSNNGAISGTVKDDVGNPISDTPVQLQSVNGNVTTVIDSTYTDSNGSYKFSDLEPGSYRVIETNLPSYPLDVKDYDTTPDGDDSEQATIYVTLKPGEIDSDNDFIDSANGSISGTVKDERLNPIPGTTITLKSSNGSIVQTTTTDETGQYIFMNLKPSGYTLLETNLRQYPGDISDIDASPDGDYDDSHQHTDNLIQVIVTPGENDTGNDFIDTDTGSIAGSVRDDDGEPLVSTLVTLKFLDGTVVATTSSNGSGDYIFINIVPGNYTVVETNDSLYPLDISDRDNMSDGDATDVDTKVDNSIGVSLEPGEKDDGNDFVDSNKGSITGNVTSDSGEPLRNVTIELTYPNGTEVNTLTDVSGGYIFVRLPPGTYTVTETNPPGFPGDLSDYDVTPDGDIGDRNSTPDNKIVVTVNPGEKDSGNNFVDIRQSATPNASQGIPALALPSPVSVLSPSSSPFSNPSFSPTPIAKGPGPSGSDYCNRLKDESSSCNVCAPFHSQDYCKESESLPLLIQARTSISRSDPTSLTDQGYWFHFLEDKIAAYLLSLEQNVPSPEIFCCVTTAAALSDCLNSHISAGVDSLVIKATSFHSNQGVYVLVPDPSTNGTINLLDKRPMSYSDVVSELSFLQATKIIVEQLIGHTLPTEYKVHIVNGEVGAIDIISNRGGDCPCYAVVDKDWNRLDKYGCFEPSGVANIDKENGCPSIDFSTGRRKAGAVKKDLYVCDSIPDIDACLQQEMIDIALEIGKRIGVYIRVDMFVAEDKVFVQEYTTNHMNGLRHCAAKLDVKTGCIDSCFLGRMWDAAGGPYGGVATRIPAKLGGFMALSPNDQCKLLTGAKTPSRKSICGATQHIKPAFLPP